MLALTLTLGPNRYALRVGTSARQLEKRIVSAMRRGAGVIRLPLASGEKVDAVVTPGLPVLVERTHVSKRAEETGEPAVDWPRLDLEEW